MTSKTAEGIKNTAKYFDDKPNEQRSRPPRVFYSREQYYKVYILQDAEVSLLLESKYSLHTHIIKELLGDFKLELVDTYSYQMNQEIFVFVITTTHVIILDVKHKAIKFNVAANNIKIFETNNNAITIFLHDNSVQTKDGLQKAGFEIKDRTIFIKNPNPEVIAKLDSKLRYLLQLIHEK